MERSEQVLRDEPESDEHDSDVNEPGGTASNRHRRTDYQPEVVTVTRVPLRSSSKHKSILKVSRAPSSASSVSLADLDYLSVPSFHGGGDSDESLTTKAPPAPTGRLRRLRLVLHYHPLSKKLRRRYRAVPPRYKYVCCLLWLTWKVGAILALVLYWLQSSSSQSSPLTQGRKLLYVVTAEHPSVADGRMPAWVAGVHSLVEDYQVHVVLIQGYAADKSDRYWGQVLASAVVDFQVWSDAVPWRQTADGRLVEDPAALRWQHRHVLKDRLLDYDVFAVFGDAVALSAAAHVDNFVERSHQWKSWGATADWPEYPRVVPGFLPLQQRHDPSLSKKEAAKGPFDPQHLCCKILNNATTDVTAGAVSSTNLVWSESSDLLAQVRVGQFQGQNFALVPSSAQGWFLTRGQLGRLLQACPTFLPPWDASNAPPCLWQRLIPLAPAEFAQSFVYDAAPLTGAEPLLLGPNALWHEWNLASVEAA